MIGARPEVLLVAGALVTLVIAATWISGPIRVFLIAQAAHWSICYLARPVVLLWVRPEPQFGDNIPDPRLADLGYDVGIAAVLRPVVFGLWLYAGLVVAYVLWTRLRAPGPRRADLPLARSGQFISTLAVLYVIGTVGRLAAIATGNNSQAGELESPNPILNLVAILATVGAIGLIVFARPAGTRNTLLLIGFLMMGELLWTAAVQSKTPVMGMALALAVRCAVTGWTRIKAAAVVTMAVVAIGGFGWLQSLKTTPAAKADASVIASAYPGIVRPFLSLLSRFDLLEAATDAYYAGPGSWLTPVQALQHAVESLIPAQLLGTEKFQSGAAWATEVRGQSVDMSQVSVSLAEGNIAEGYVLGGYIGVALGVSVTFALLLIWSRWLYSRSVTLAVLGLAFIEAPVLYERGMLGAVETLGKYLQALVLVWIVALLVEEYRRRMRPRPLKENAEMREAQWV
ncbi:hypothetical protein [Nocardia alni]|uniref:hypothetical protein n=1 Tax=Nocardia alni TaxID=2815723 RepID=UPI001C22BA99|nr:hypothetical protein [Nocardia alni]